ncbi:MAG: DUF1574 family protein [Planctomycetes bacterium]|nr:DUF1574 family protein [Planctomycetota bacterium]
MKLSALFRQVLAWPQWTVRTKRTSLKPRRLAGRCRRARSSLAFTPVAGILLLIAGWSFADTYVPEITDTEYHHRLGVIRKAVAEHPRNPLAVIIGSSRMVWGFRPETLPEPQPGELYWLNSSHVGGGPILNRLMMHRLLRDGVKPDVVVLEVMPAFFMRENTRFVMSHFTAPELKVTREYGKFPLHYDYHFLRDKVARMPELGRVFDPYNGIKQLLPRGGHPKCEESVTEEQRDRRTAIVKNVYREDLAKMNVRPGADLAFRDTLRDAAAHGVRVVLIRTPEGPVFQSWYDPAGAARFDAYLADVAREFGVPILDARNWLYEDDFFDSHHMLRKGGDKFTARFAQEIVPIVGR